MKGYSEIRLLEKDVADRIAAGEVVERPLSVVKELTENSIDAGATSITVEIEKGGKDYIRVSDNGRGIASGEVELAFRRHATSKIRLEEDLSRIQTLGFRGEALASIAAISKTELITRTAFEKAGTRICISGGETLELGSIASDEGTTIIVRDLFYNTPARRKFLKSDSAEASLIIDYLSKMALACTDVRIRVKNNGNILFSTRGTGELLKAVQTVYPGIAEMNLLAAKYTEGGYTLKGYVSAPTASRRDRRQQIFFVNGRLVRSRTLEIALDEAYRDKLFEGRYPAAVLFVETDPSAVDVNIHPHKTEIRFFDDQAVYEFMVRGIRQTLLAPSAGDAGASLAGRAQVPDGGGAGDREGFGDGFGAGAGSDATSAAAGLAASPAAPVQYADVINLSSIAQDTFFSQLREKAEAEELYGNGAAQPPDDADGPDAADANGSAYGSGSRPDRGIERGVQQQMAEASFDPDLRHLKFSSLEPVGQVFATYIVLRDEGYVYFVDQHAAHERVMYERLLSAFNSQETLTQVLLMPQIIQFSASDKAAAEGKTKLLRDLGYVIEDFGPSEYIVKEVPAFFDESEAMDFLRSVVESGFSDIQARRDEIIMASCKSAVKGNDLLAPEEIRQLFADLDRCENPYNCPHGRPTYIRFSQYDLEKMFKRK